MSIEQVIADAVVARLAEQLPAALKPGDVPESAGPSRLIKASEICNRLSISGPTFRSRIKGRNGFPAPIRPAVDDHDRWLEADVEAWIRDRWVRT